MKHPFCKLCEKWHHSECLHDDIGLNPACAKILTHGHHPLNLGWTAERPFFSVALGQPTSANPTRSAYVHPEGKKLMASNPALDKLAQSHLLGLIQPEDITNAALSLASDASRMVTGQSLPVDSGVTIS